MRADKPVEEGKNNMASVYIRNTVTKEELEFLTPDELNSYREKLAIFLYDGIPRYLAELAAYLWVQPEADGFDQAYEPVNPFNKS